MGKKIKINQIANEILTTNPDEIVKKYGNNPIKFNRIVRTYLTNQRRILNSKGYKTTQYDRILNNQKTKFKNSVDFKATIINYQNVYNSNEGNIDKLEKRRADFNKKYNENFTIKEYNNFMQTVGYAYAKLTKDENYMKYVNKYDGIVSSDDVYQSIISMKTDRYNVKDILNKANEIIENEVKEYNNRIKAMENDKSPTMTPEEFSRIFEDL